MSYLFTGRLSAHSCGGSVVPVSDATLKLYRLAEQEERGFAVQTPEDVRGRDFGLFAQGRTDADGVFSIDLTEKSIFGHRGSTHPYGGAPFVLDVVSRGLEGIARGDDVEPVQYSIGVVAPDWIDAGGRREARWEHVISAEQWAQVRAALDTWTILGTVSGRDGRLEGLKVLAYDADLIQDDFLGEAITDAQGRFRIDYPGSAFRQTVVPGADFERGGPELYFRIEDASGATVYQENKSRGSQADRADAGNCATVELRID